MIYITQGHEHSIALEIFLKSFLKLTPDEQDQLTLVCSKKIYFEQLLLLGFEDKQFSQLKILEIKKEDNSLTLESLYLALSCIKEKDILVTLPTSKDQLFINGIHHLGYTEYLRHHFKKPELAMTFKAPEEFLLLMTDHLPLAQVPGEIKKEKLLRKIELTIKEYEKYFDKLEEVILAGLNPHAGENGLLGTEDQEIILAIEELKNIFPRKKFLGPLSGDTLHFYQDRKKSQLFVYMYHDQGLPSFKARHGLTGINLTLGLPFLRMSVDHGTAFELYGKNQASSEGCEYVLKTALAIHKK